MNNIQRLAEAKRLLIFLDYDGTLVPIKNRPQNAVLHPARREFLERLSQRAFVCIVTGRSLDNIKRLIALDHIAYIGNHGLEICWDHRLWIHPKATRNLDELRMMLSVIKDKTSYFPRLKIEDKGITASIHFRGMAPNLVPSALKIVKNVVKRSAPRFLLAEGKKVLEIRPNLGWDKGKGVKKLRRWIPADDKPLAIYIGDDQTDEDAFRALGRKAITIHVGRKSNTLALYRLATVDKVWDFLRELQLSLGFSV